MHHPFIYKLETGKSDILDKKPDHENLLLSPTISQPLISLGFQTFLHRTKNAMSITNKLDTKNKFYYVVNPFEHVISNYEDSLNNLTKTYLNIKDTHIKDEAPDILSRAFYKMWEMLFLFDLASKKEMTVASLAEGPGAFIQAVINFRQKLGSGVNKDKIFGVTIHPEQDKYIEMGQQFLGYYEENHPGLLNIHETVSSVQALKSKGKDNGDITQIKTISAFKKDIEKSKTYADLVTADGGFKWKNENYQEQEAYQLILGEIVAALKVQAKEGHFILKVFETFTHTSIKIIYLLSSFYDETYIYKPLFSRESNSEKYIICKGFKYDQKKDEALLETKLKNLEQILVGMNTDKFVMDIFPKLNIPREYLDTFRYLNTKIANKQQTMINDIVTYIKENNYFGDRYHKYREEQINSTKWWVSNFYPPSSNLIEKNREDLMKLFKMSTEKTFAEKSKLASTLV